MDNLQTNLTQMWNLDGNIYFAVEGHIDHSQCGETTVIVTTTIAGSF
jgi:hypothetical protein